jgi:hypothetical protein
MRTKPEQPTFIVRKRLTPQAAFAGKDACDPVKKRFLLFYRLRYGKNKPQVRSEVIRSKPLKEKPK